MLLTKEPTVILLGGKVGGKKTILLSKTVTVTMREMLDAEFDPHRRSHVIINSSQAVRTALRRLV